MSRFSGCSRPSALRPVRRDDRSGARIVRHGRYVVFQLAEVAMLRALFAAILRRIAHLRGAPVAVT